LKEYGDVYSLTAIKPDTRLFISHHEGKRTADDCIDFFNDTPLQNLILETPLKSFKNRIFIIFRLNMEISSGAAFSYNLIQYQKH